GSRFIPISGLPAGVGQYGGQAAQPSLLGAPGQQPGSHPDQADHHRHAREQNELVVATEGADREVLEPDRVKSTAVPSTARNGEELGDTNPPTSCPTPSPAATDSKPTYAATGVDNREVFISTIMPTIRSTTGRRFNWRPNCDKAKACRCCDS